MSDNICLIFPLANGNVIIVKGDSGVDRVKPIVPHTQPHVTFFECDCFSRPFVSVANNAFPLYYYYYYIVPVPCTHTMGAVSRLSRRLLRSRKVYCYVNVQKCIIHFIFFESSVVFFVERARFFYVVILFCLLWCEGDYYFSGVRRSCYCFCWRRVRVGFGVGRRRGVQSRVLDDYIWCV